MYRYFETNSQPMMSDDNNFKEIYIYVLLFNLQYDQSLVVRTNLFEGFNN